MDSDTVLRMRLLQRLEQLQAALAAGDSSAVEEARGILRRMVCKGSRAMLAQVFRGIILAWDEEQAEWERIA